METINDKTGSEQPVHQRIQKRKLSWYGDVSRHTSISMVLLQGTSRAQEKMRKAWKDVT